MIGIGLGHTRIVSACRRFDRSRTICRTAEALGATHPTRPISQARGSKSSLIRRILDEALAITQATVSVEEAIHATSGIWADRDDADLQEVLEWRREAPLERLTR